jgi:hypothetical protein
MTSFERGGTRALRKQMLETILSEIEETLAPIAHRRGWDELASFSQRVRHIGSEEGVVVVAAPRSVDASAFIDWIKASGSRSKPCLLSFDDLVADPWPLLNTRCVVGLFDCGQVISAKEAETISRLFFGRPPGSYALVLQRSEVLRTPEDLDLVRRIAWRMLVPPAHGPWRQQELSRYGVYLWSPVTVNAVVEDAVRRDRVSVRDWLSEMEPDREALRRIGALYFLEQARQRLEASASDAARESQAIRYGEISRRASVMLAGLEKRLKSRWDADIHLLARQVATDIDTAKDQSLVSSNGRNSLRSLIGGNPGNEAATQKLAEFIRNRMNQTDEMISAKVRDRLETVSKEMQLLVTASDWSNINLWATEKGEKVLYPEALGKAPIGRISEREFSSIPVELLTYKPTNGPTAMLFQMIPAGFVGGILGWSIAGFLHFVLKLHLLHMRTFAGGIGVIGGALFVWFAGRAQRAAEFENEARRCLTDSLLRMRDAAPDVVLNLPSNQGFAEWIGRISELRARMAAAAEAGEFATAYDHDLEDLKIMESAIEKISAYGRAREQAN